MKKTSLKLLSAILTAIILLGCASVSAVHAEGAEGDIIVLYTNDVHCGTDGYPILAAYRASLIEQGHRVFTVDAGDAVQGEVIGALTEGGAIVEIMNAVGYDYAAIGNHEFDYTVDGLMALAEKAEYEYLCANFRYIPEDRLVFAPYAIAEADGKKIAFVGIATPETYTKTTPTYFQDENGNYIYGFSADELYATVQSAVDEAIAKGAETVIAIGHLGIAAVTEGWRSTDLIANTHGIDAFLDAHAHEVIESADYKNDGGEDVALSSTGTKLEYFGKLTIGSDGGITTELIKPEDIDIDSLSDGAKKAHGNVKDIIDGYNAKHEYLYEVIGSSEVLLTENDAQGNWIIRAGETNLGNFVADAYKSITGADIAMVNGGGVRAELKAGDITRTDLMNVNPWSNAMCVIKARGRQILDALEFGVSLMPVAHGSFPHTAGLSFEVHTYVESPVVVDGYGTFVSVKEGAPRRVRNVKVGGVPIDEDAVYTLAGSEYMLLLSDYTMLKECEIVEKEGLSTDAEMLIAYFTETLGGLISEEQYGKPEGEGRMTVVDKAPAEGTTPPTGDGGIAVWSILGVLAAAGLAAVTKKRESIQG